MTPRWLLPSALVLTLLAGSCKTSNEAGTAATSSAASTQARPSAVPSTDASAKPKPTPPKDAAKACEVAFTGKFVEFLGKPGLEYTMANRSDRGLRFCQITAYAYDETGKQLGRDSMAANRELKPGEVYTSTSGLPVADAKGKALVNEPGVTFEPVVSQVIFADDSEWRDDGLIPATRPQAGKK